MSNPFGAFSPSTEPPQPVDAEFEEVQPEEKPEPPPAASPVDPDVVLEIEAALDEEVVEYRQQLGLISPITLSKILGVHHDTLKGWRTEGRGPNYLKIGKRVWYSLSAVLVWLPTQEVKRVNTKEGLQKDGRPERTEPEQPGATPDDTAGTARADTSTIPT